MMRGPPALEQQLGLPRYCFISFLTAAVFSGLAGERSNTLNDPFRSLRQ